MLWCCVKIQEDFYTLMPGALWKEGYKVLDEEAWPLRLINNAFVPTLTPF